MNGTAIWLTKLPSRLTVAAVQIFLKSAWRHRDRRGPAAGSDRGAAEGTDGSAAGLTRSDMAPW
jgi:hypothetical protein